MLTLWLMPQMQDNTKKFIHQLNGAPTHLSTNVRDYLDKHPLPELDESQFPTSNSTNGHRGMLPQLEKPIPWKRVVWDNVPISHSPRKGLIINTYSPLHSAYVDKFIYTAEIAVIAFLTRFYKFHLYVTESLSSIITHLKRSD
ncbi:hypothetical protein TNCV_4925771 [Trichonephila clavipes]|nr:hypothetical protein TNCV_4925771 [Trichonephila clavipes]